MPAQHDDATPAGVGGCWMRTPGQASFAADISTRPMGPIRAMASAPSSSIATILPSRRNEWSPTVSNGLRQKIRCCLSLAGSVIFSLWRRLAGSDLPPRCSWQSAGFRFVLSSSLDGLQSVIFSLWWRLVGWNLPPRCSQQSAGWWSVGSSSMDGPLQLSQFVPPLVIRSQRSGFSSF